MLVPLMAAPLLVLLPVPTPVFVLLLVLLAAVAADVGAAAAADACAWASGGFLIKRLPPPRLLVVSPPGGTGGWPLPLPPPLPPLPLPPPLPPFTRRCLATAIALSNAPPFPLPLLLPLLLEEVVTRFALLPWFPFIASRWLIRSSAVSDRAESNADEDEPVCWWLGAI
jgi:hypothetical protein